MINMAKSHSDSSQVRQDQPESIKGSTATHFCEVFCLSTTHVRSNYSLDLHLVRAPGGHAYHCVGYARKFKADAAKNARTRFVRDCVINIRLLNQSRYVNGSRR